MWVRLRAALPPSKVFCRINSLRRLKMRSNANHKRRRRTSRAIAGPVKIESVELRVLFSTITEWTFGGTGLTKGTVTSAPARPPAPALRLPWG